MHATMNPLVFNVHIIFMHWFIDPIKDHYADFTGRVGRQEFWMFILVYIGIAIAVSIVTTMLRVPMVYTLFGLAMMVPSWAITARRLHDVNKSGWWQLIALIPLVGIIVLIIWLAGESKNEGNQFGEATTTAAPDATAAPIMAEVPQEAPVAEVPAEPENTQQGFGN